MDQDKIKRLTLEIKRKYGSECLKLMQELIQASTDFEVEIFKKSLEKGFVKGDKLTRHDYNLSVAVHATGIIDLLMRQLGVEDFYSEAFLLKVFNERRTELEGGV